MNITGSTSQSNLVLGSVHPHAHPHHSYPQQHQQQQQVPPQQQQVREGYPPKGPKVSVQWRIGTIEFSRFDKTFWLSLISASKKNSVPSPIINAFGLIFFYHCCCQCCLINAYLPTYFLNSCNKRFWIVNLIVAPEKRARPQEHEQLRN